MNNFPILKIKKRPQPIWLIMFIIMMPFTFGTILDFLRLPNAIKYSLDICWIALIVLMAFNLSRKRIAIEKGSLHIYVWILAFVVFTAVVYIFNYQSPLYYLWGFRNNFRFYIFFFACILFLKNSDLIDIFKAFDVFFWVNALICCIQYFLFDINRDYLGGLFGVEKGCNGYLNIFFVIYATKTIVRYLNHLEPLSNMLVKCALILIISAFAELKFVYIEFVMIISIAVLISEFSWRKVWVVVGGIIGIILAINVLEMLFPFFDDFFTLDRMIDISSTAGYSSTNELNRLTTIPQISNDILTDTSDKFLGLGLGNCDTAAYDFLKTPFYLKYADIKYHWFSTSFLFLETGFIGLTIFLGFFIIIFHYSLKQKNILNTHSNSSSLCQISAIIAVMSIMITVYNSSLRTEAGYLIYFMLALPFIAKKEDGNANE